MSASGFAFAALSAVFNGSFSSCFKAAHVQAVDPHPLVFMFYASLGVALSSQLVIFLIPLNSSISSEWSNRLAFAPLGVASGALFVLSISASFLAVHYIGVALAQGIWGAVAILTSFAWGVLAFGNRVTSWGLASAALLLLLAGGGCIAHCDALGRLATGQGRNADERVPLTEISGGRGARPGDRSINSAVDAEVGHPPVPPASRQRAPADDKAPAAAAAGAFWAAMVGLIGGSILVPATYATADHQGLVLLPSFGLGSLLAAPVVAAVWVAAEGRGWPPPHVKVCGPAGLASGVVWNAGNVCSVLAIPALGFSVAYPLMQTALFVAGVWGIVVFGEIRGASLPFFWGGGAVLLAGAACLALAVEA